jgi:hypothetical protein
MRGHYRASDDAKAGITIILPVEIEQELRRFAAQRGTAVNPLGPGLDIEKLAAASTCGVILHPLYKPPSTTRSIFNATSSRGQRCGPSEPKRRRNGKMPSQQHAARPSMPSGRARLRVPRTHPLKDQAAPVLRAR